MKGESKNFYNGGMDQGKNILGQFFPVLSNYRGFRKYRIRKLWIFGNNGHFGDDQIEIWH